jgi:hypothetical protein
MSSREGEAFSIIPGNNERNSSERAKSGFNLNTKGNRQVCPTAADWSKWEARWISPIGLTVRAKRSWDPGALHG